MVRRRQRLALGILAVFAAVAASYLAAVHVLLNGGAVERWVNRRPAGWSVRWDSAWSVVPWRVHFRDAALERAGHTSRLELTLERGVMELELPPLFDRVLHATSLEASGLRFRVDRRTPPAARTGAPGLGPARPRRASTRRGWRVELDDIQIASVRAVEIDDLALHGEGTVAGALALEVGGELEMPSLRVELGDFTTTFTGGGTETPLDLRFRGRLAPFSPREVRGWSTVRFLEGELEASGDAPLEFIGYFLRNAGWIDGMDGFGHVDLDLRLRGGRLAPGSRLAAETRGLSYSALGMLAEGAGRARVEVVDEAGAARGRLEVALESFDARHAESGQPYVRGRLLELSATSEDPDLVSGFGELDVGIAIHDAEMVDVAVFDRYLPRGAAVAIRGGAVRIDGTLGASTRDDRPSGRIGLASNHLRFAVGELDLDAALDATVVVSGGNLAERRFEIDGTEIRLDRIGVEEAGRQRQDGGWLRAKMSRARLGIASPFSLDADLVAGAGDTRILLAFLAERRQWVGHFTRLLTIRDLEARARLVLGDGRLDLRQVRADGRAFHLEAELAADETAKRALVYAKYHGIAIGLETGVGKPDLRLIRARAWYDEAASDARWARR